VAVSVAGVDDASVLVEGVVAASLDCVTAAADDVFNEELLRRPMWETARTAQLGFWGC
jgi:hypothetical protein